MAIYSLAEISQYTHVDLATLVQWDQKYELIPSKQKDKERYFTGSGLRAVLNIDYLRRRGSELSALSSLTPSDLESAVLEHAEKELRYPLQIRLLTTAMRSMNESLFLKTVRNLVDELGFEEAMTQVVYGFLYWVGILWQTRSISVAHEHFSSQLIRQFLVSSIASLPDPDPMNPLGKHFLLFLPEGEEHELGLLLSAYLIKSRNHRVTYLGNSIPANSLRSIQAQHHTDFVLPVFITRPVNGHFRAYVETLVELFGAEKVLLAGSPLLLERVQIPEGVSVYNSLDKLQQFLDEISLRQGFTNDDEQLA